MQATGNSRERSIGQEASCFGLAFLVAWLIGAMQLEVQPALAICTGFACGCVVLLALGRASEDARARWADTPAFVVAGGMLMALAACAAWRQDSVALALCLAGGAGCASCVAAWFSRIAQLRPSPMMRVSLMSVLAALAAYGILDATWPDAAACITLAAGGAGEAVFSAWTLRRKRARVETGSGSRPNAERVPPEESASAPRTSGSGDQGLPAPGTASLVAYLGIMSVLFFYFGTTLFFSRAISANAWQSSLLSVVFDIVILAVVLVWTGKREQGWDAMPAFNALLLLLLLAFLVVLFVDRQQKVVLMALQSAMPLVAFVLLWLSAAVFVERGTYSLPGAFAVPFALVAACFGGGLVFSTLPVFKNFLAVFPHEGVYLLIVCAVLVLAYGFSTVAGFLRETQLLRRAPAHEEVTVKLEADYLSERCDALAAEHALTAREREIVELLAVGRSRPYIAENLCLSENTVKWYCRQIYQKLDIHSKQELLTLIGMGQ